MAHRTGTSGYKSSPDLLSVSFNQDYSCVAVGSRKGYLIANCEPYGKVYSKCEGQGATCIAEMLFCTSLVALVGAGDRPASSMRRLQIVNTKRNSLICELNFPTTILAVRLNRRRLVVVLEEQIYVYDISNLRLLHTIETSPNPNAICSLAPSSENSYLAYPSPLPSTATPFSAVPPAANPPAAGSTVGDVLLFDAISLSVTNVIQAHKAPLSALAFNAQGNLLATSSDKGTVIRVFNCPEGDKVAEFRRGTYPSRIFSLAFNAVSTLLCVSSASDTVHIFKLIRGGNAPKRNGLSRNPSDYDDDGASSASTASLGRGNAPGYEAFIDSKRSSMGSLRKKSLSLGKSVAGSVGGFLPGTLTQMWEPQRDFAFLKLPVSGVKSIVALNGTAPQVFVVTSEGTLYSYHLDLEVGGECVLQKSYNLLDFDDPVLSE